MTRNPISHDHSNRGTGGFIPGIWARDGDFVPLAYMNNFENKSTSSTTFVQTAVMFFPLTDIDNYDGIESLHISAIAELSNDTSTAATTARLKGANYTETQTSSNGATFERFQLPKQPLDDTLVEAGAGHVRFELKVDDGTSTGTLSNATYIIYGKVGSVEQ